MMNYMMTQIKTDTEKIKCLICGLSFKRVCSHVRLAHGVSAREYKEEFGLDVRRGIMTDAGRAVMREHAYRNHERLKLAGVNTRFKKGQKDLGKFKRSEQTLERLHTMNGSKPKEKTYITITCGTCSKEFPAQDGIKYIPKFCSRRCSTINSNKLRKKK